MPSWPSGCSTMGGRPHPPWGSQPPLHGTPPAPPGPPPQSPRPLKGPPARARCVGSEPRLAAEQAPRCEDKHLLAAGISRISRCSSWSIVVHVYILPARQGPLWCMYMSLRPGEGAQAGWDTAGVICVSKSCSSLPGGHVCQGSQLCNWITSARCCLDAHEAEACPGAAWCQSGRLHSWSRLHCPACMQSWAAAVQTLWGPVQAGGKGDAATRRRVKALRRTFPEVNDYWAAEVLAACDNDLARAKQVRLGVFSILEFGSWVKGLSCCMTLGEPLHIALHTCPEPHC